MLKLDTNQILHLVQEECAETTQAISKIFRFGPLNSHPDREKTNIQELEEEVGDLLCLIDLLTDNDYLNYSRVLSAKANKLKKLERWGYLVGDK